MLIQSLAPRGVSAFLTETPMIDTVLRRSTRLRLSRFPSKAWLSIANLPATSRRVRITLVLILFGPVRSNGLFYCQTALVGPMSAAGNKLTALASWITGI